MKLSQIQFDLLRAIASSASKRIVTIGGGYWAVDGVRVSEGARTVHALERRELVAKLPGARYSSTYELTKLGVILLLDAGMHIGSEGRMAP
jgi:hypothetical protein